VVWLELRPCTITCDANGFSVDARSGGNLHSNTTMWVRDDGSILATSRDGVIILSTTGVLGPYKVQSTSVYDASIKDASGGTPEDPVGSCPWMEPSTGYQAKHVPI
jgi:hypothetical protein